MKTIKIIDLFNMIINGKYDEIKKLKMFYQDRRIYFDKSLGCNLSSIKFSDTNKKVIHSDMNLLEEIKIVEEILDTKEKEYLSNVIRPFRKQVIWIKKYNFSQEFIEIRIKENIASGQFNNICFPFFEKGTMYKNMEPDKEYMLDELGI